MTNRARRGNHLNVFRPASTTRNGHLHAIRRLGPHHCHRRTRHRVGRQPRYQIIIIRGRPSRLVQRRPRSRHGHRRQDTTRRSPSPAHRPHVRRLPNTMVLTSTRNSHVQGPHQRRRYRQGGLRHGLVHNRLHTTRNTRTRHNRHRRASFRHMNTTGQRPRAPRFFRMLPIQPQRTLARQVDIMDQIPTGIRHRHRNRRINGGYHRRTGTSRARFQRTRRTNSRHVIRSRINRHTTRTSRRR